MWNWFGIGVTHLFAKDFEFARNNGNNFSDNEHDWNAFGVQNSTNFKHIEWQKGVNSLSTHNWMLHSSDDGTRDGKRKANGRERVKQSKATVICMHIYLMHSLLLKIRVEKRIVMTTFHGIRLQMGKKFLCVFICITAIRKKSNSNKFFSK